MDRKNRQRFRRRQWLSRIINVVIVLLILIGTVFIFNEQIKTWLVASSPASVNNETAEKIIKNQGADADFDFNKVKSLDFSTIISARMKGNKELTVIGGISIPSAKINLPIGRGVGNYTLAVSAGTMKPDQKMGVGNYALAGHHMVDPKVLFGPLYKTELGDKIYLTDLTSIYVYQVDWKNFVSPTRVDLIDDVANQTKLTLVTCDDTGAGRLVVQASFVKQVLINQASTQMQAVFNLQENKDNGQV